MNDSVVEKIKKLLRMKRGGSAAEIETALNLAREIAAKHGIDIASINPDEESEQRRISHEDAFTGTRIQWECMYAALIAQNFFNVSIFRRRSEGYKPTLTFVGTSWDLQIALYVYNFLVGQFRRQWSRTSSRHRNRRSFMYGMFRGICSNLAARKEAEPKNENAVLVVNRAVQRRDDYIAKNFGEMVSEDTRPDDDAKSARLAGWLAGKETNINPGLRAPRVELLLPGPGRE